MAMQMHPYFLLLSSLLQLTFDLYITVATGAAGASFIAARLPLQLFVLRHLFRTAQ